VADPVSNPQISVNAAPSVGTSGASGAMVPSVVEALSRTADARALQGQNQVAVHQDQLPMFTYSPPKSNKDVVVERSLHPCTITFSNKCV
jgi:hypothetical protein